MNALQKIQIEAKKIRKAKPSMKYTDAVKLASVKYNAGKLGAVAKVTPKKKSAPKLPVKKIVTTVTKEKIAGANYIDNNVLVRISSIIKEITQERTSVENLKVYIKKQPEFKTVYTKQIQAKNKYISTLIKQKNELKKHL